MAASSNTTTHLVKPFRRAWSVCALVLLAGCTNSELVLRPVYNTLDNRIEKRVRRVVTLTPEQRQSVRTLSDDFHLWHRWYELPQYAALLQDVSDQLADQTVTQDSVDGWFAAASEARERMYLCSPTDGAAGVLASLSDEQVAEIGEKLLSTDRFVDDDDEEDWEREPHLRIKRYLSLIGFRMQPDQVERLRLTMAASRAERAGFEDFLAFTQEWNGRFVVLLEARESPDFDIRLHSYLKQRHRASAARRQESLRAMWRTYVFQELQNLSEPQRRFAVRWIVKLSRTVLAISKRGQNRKSDKPALTACNVLRQS